MLVDLPRLGRAVPSGTGVLVGHLAHLLPVRAAIVLRCHPSELELRLKRAGRGTPAERRENVAAEATDVVLVEALGRGLTVWEIDTTGRSAESVARAVASRLRRGGPPRYGRIDWLGDRAVTEHLLDRPS